MLHARPTPAHRRPRRGRGNTHGVSCPLRVPPPAEKRSRFHSGVALLWLLAGVAIGAGVLHVITP